MKQTKQSVQYTDHAMVRNQRCALCKYFIPMGAFKINECTKVTGSIAANGWCKLFERKEK